MVLMFAFELQTPTQIVERRAAKYSEVIFSYLFGVFVLFTYVWLKLLFVSRPVRVYNVFLMQLNLNTCLFI